VRPPRASASAKERLACRKHKRPNYQDARITTYNFDMAGLNSVERDSPRGESKGEQATEAGVQYEAGPGGGSNVQRRGVSDPTLVGGEARLNPQI
jgi:hypothetical protein